MTWPLWLGLMLCMLAVAAAGLCAYGERRWAGATEALQRMLEAGRIDGPRNAATLPTRYDMHELEGLPAQVQRYFRAALKDGQPIVSAVTIDMACTQRSRACSRWPTCVVRER